MSSSVSKSSSARGRTISSKPLATSTGSSASTRAKQGPAIGKSLVKAPASGTTKAPARPTVVPKSTPVQPTSQLDVDPSIATRKQAKPDASAPSPTAAKPPAQPPTIQEKVPAPTSDALQVASQLYPWLYMTSTLEACFQTAEQTAEKDLNERSQELAKEESELADQRARFQAEKAVDFYDELATDTFAKEAPEIMQTFLSHGDECSQVEAAALQLAMRGPDELDEDAPLQVYNEMLGSLEGLHTRALELETSILKLTETGSSSPFGESGDTPRSQIISVFSACLPVLRARISNLSMAQELIDGAQENLSINLRMESLGLLD